MSDPTSPSAPPADQATATLDPDRWIALAVLLAASFMNLVDVTIVNLAIPSIERDLHASSAQIELVVAAYQLPFAALLITGGRLGDVVGRKRMFVAGLVSFGVASVLCGAAGSGSQLIAARILQGATVAVMLPQVLSTIQVTFPPRERSRAFGSYAAVIGLASIIGPLAGGLLIQSDVLGLGWRSVFLVNGPIVVAATLGALRFLHESRAPGPARLDLVGVVLIAVAMLLVVWPLAVGRQEGWPPWASASLAAAVPALALFVWWERRMSLLDRSPLVATTMLGERGFVTGLAIAFVAFLALSGLILFFALYLQSGLGFTPLAAGLTTVPFPIATVVGSGVAAGLMPKLGPRVLSIGAATLWLGLLLLLLILWLGAVPLAHGWQLAPVLVLAGFGWGLVLGPVFDVTLAGTPEAESGAASGVLNNCNVVASALGVVLLGVVFFGQLTAAAGQAGATAATTLRGRLLAAGLAPGSADQVAHDFAACFGGRTGAGQALSAPLGCGHVPVPDGSSASPAVATALTAAPRQALGLDFTVALRRTILWVLALYLLVFALTFRLPREQASARSKESEL
jgi:EmrB/QacA subfamily drug resistance transporter